MALAARAQSDFHAYLGSEDLIEGGRVEKLTVVTSNLLFNIRPPRGWTRQVNEAGQKIIFTAPSGKSAITVQFTGNSPGKLPDADTLRAQALAAHPGAGFIQSGIAPTGYKPGLFFDLVRMPAPGVVQKLRHVYLPQPAGEVEFILAASGDEFEQKKQVLISTLRGFRVQAEKPK
jgi:hypothetical protein